LTPRGGRVESRGIGMKLRLRGNSLRLRLQKPEVASLAQGAAVVDSTQFGPEPESRFVCRIEARGDAQISTRFAEGVLTVTVPETTARSWADNETVGLYAETVWGLKIALEKDFRCLEPRPGEDEGGAYERPAGYLPDPCSTDER
jgi:hypothetical protein